MLQKFRNLLKAGGSILLDVHSINDFDQKAEGASYAVNLLNNFWSPARYYGFLNTFKYQQEKVSLDKYTIIEAGRTRTIFNWLQYYTQQSLAQEFAENDLHIRKYLANVAGDEFEADGTQFAIIAQAGK